MAKRRSAEAEVRAPLSAQDRIANLLALQLVKGLDAAEQIVTLDQAGFEPADIARLLGTTTNNVAVTKYKHRNASKKKKKKAD